MRRRQLVTDEAILCLQGIFSQERSPGEPQGAVQPVDEGQAAREQQAVHGPQAAHEPLYSHSSERRLRFSEPTCFRSYEQ
jgi:hypothetical protein